MKHIKLIAATALIMAATPAFAANWVYVTISESNVVWSYDRDTIQRSGSQVTVWEKRDSSLDKTAQERERKVRYRYDCAERTGTALQTTVYYRDGKVETVRWEAYQQKELAVTPDTMQEAMLKAVCAATAP